MATRLSLLLATLLLAMRAGEVAGQEALPAPRGAASADVGRRYLPPPAFPQPAPAIDRRLMATDVPQAARPSFTLDALVDLAVKNNPTLRQAQAHISAELGKALQAGLYPNPALQYAGELINARNNAQARTAGEFQGGGLQQQLVTGGKLALSREKYIQRARISEHLAVAQQFKVLNDVRIHFYRTLAAAEILAIERELLKSAEDRSLTSRELFNQGQATRPDVRQADIALTRCRLAVLAAENEYAARFTALTSIVGIPTPPGQVSGQLAPNEPPAEFEVVLGRLWAESPQLAAARAKLVCDQITVRREQVQWVPNLTLSGGTGYDFQDRGTVANAGMFMDVPLFDRNQGTVRQAQADLARQQNEICRLQLDLRMRLAEVYQRYATALQHAAQYERVILPESREAYRELLESYKVNRAEWPDVLDAQHEYFNARREYVRHLEAFRASEVLLVGFLLHDGLEAALGPTPPGHIDSVPKPR